jgi:pyridoxal 5'-phosphate synthase pdxS subunit
MLMSHNNGSPTSLRLKTGLAEMLKGGVIMDVINAEQAVIAEKAGAVSVMALERVPAQIRAEGGVARMASPKKIREIMAAVSIPVMAKCRIGHFAEAQILQELGVDYIDESEVLTPADEAHHVDKHAFTVPFVCGARNLGEALRRIAEGAAMIRTKGEAGTGDVVHAVKHMRQIVQEMRILTVLGEEELYAKAKEHQAPYELVRMVAKPGSCRCRISRRAELPLRRMRRWSCNWSGIGVRRLRHLHAGLHQLCRSRRSREAGQGDRAGRHTLQRS